MAPHTTKTAALLALAARGPIRSRDLDEAGIPRAYLRRLCDRGVLERVARGLYRQVGAPPHELDSLAEVAKLLPHATICLLSAMQVHGLATAAPHAVWILIDRRARTPVMSHLPLEVVRASGAARDHGVETRVVSGVTVRITSPAKTVADCFRYRRLVGLEVAIEALRDYLQGNSAATQTPSESRPLIDALVEASRADRVYSVIRPYLEALA